MNRDLHLIPAALSVLHEVVGCPAENQTIEQTASKNGTLSLEQALKELGPLPEEALFLGLAGDGLPVLVNLWDPTPGPILVAGDSYAGKTGFLQNLSRFTIAAHGAGEIQYGVITAQPDQWEAAAGHPNCVGVFPAAGRSVADFMQALVVWINLNRKHRQSVLLLIDGLDDLLSANRGLAHGLQHVLLYGPANRIWPFITVNLECFLYGEPWLKYFHTRVFGYTAHAGAMNDEYSDAEFENLSRGREFCMKESSQWLKFRIPA
jgi:hypothetical protein